MDGVLIIDKPAGMTSHDVVNRVRRVLKTKRVGHTGTLDPFATGVLVLLIGKATRLARFVDKAAKEYVAEIRFGFATDTGDVTGRPLSEEQRIKFTSADLGNVLTKFLGEIEQVPPMYSAKKVGGKKLYEHARKGEVIEREPAKITIYEIAVLEANLDGRKATAQIRVLCSAGTYIRTLAEDIGKSLGIGAHLESLRRTAVAQFDVRHAVPLNKFERENSPWLSLEPWEKLVSHLPQFELPNERVQPTLNGLPTRVERGDLGDGDNISMYEPDGNIVAIGVFDASENCVRPNIVLV